MAFAAGSLPVRGVFTVRSGERPNHADDPGSDSLRQRRPRAADHHQVGVIRRGRRVILRERGRIR